ncbi:MAG: sugar phosphate isomerase/epimerase [Caldilineaceae bacterium]|nr:sugar phosphate isomerase/epimerase [Caldilineaceae bacterium]
MQFGANTWIWHSPLNNERLRQIIPHVARLGFDWIELPIEAPHDFDYALARELTQAHGLGVSLSAATGPGRDLISADPTERQSCVAYLRHCILAAETIGATNIIGPIYSAVGRTWQATAAERERAMELLMTNLRPLAQYAGDHGITLCIEPLNRFETSFINLTTQGIELVDRVDHPACGLLLDTFHMNIEERSLGDAIRAAGSRVKHIHACENDRGAPGTGHVPWDQVAAGLHDIHYNGPVVIESFSVEVQVIARAAAIWRPLATSQDQLASDGLCFLHSLLQGD